MEFVWNALQRFAYHKEEKPREQKTEPELDQPSDIAQIAMPRQFRFRHPGQAGGAEHPVIVFRDAFTAEVTRTAGAAGGSFPFDMIEAALVSQIGHV